MILEAAQAGVDCVKFQKSCLEEKFTVKALQRPYDSVNSFGATYGEHKRFLEFSIEQFKELKDYAESCGLVFSASAMDKVSESQPSGNPSLISFSISLIRFHLINSRNWICNLSKLVLVIPTTFHLCVTLLNRKYP